MNSGTPLEASCQDAFADKSLTKDLREWVDPFMSWMDQFFFEIRSFGFGLRVR